MAEFHVGMIVESYRVGTCKVVELTTSELIDWVHFEYIGIMYHNGKLTDERRLFRNADPIECEDEYHFFYAESGATLD